MLLTYVYKLLQGHTKLVNHAKKLNVLLNKIE